jgi:hypothetical protein
VSLEAVLQVAEFVDLAADEGHGSSALVIRWGPFVGC